MDFKSFMDEAIKNNKGTEMDLNKFDAGLIIGIACKPGLTNVFHHMDLNYKMDPYEEELLFKKVCQLIRFNHHEIPITEEGEADAHRLYTSLIDHM